MLSERELEIVQDTKWILTKQQIIATVFHLFNEQVPVIQQQIEASGYVLPPELLAAVPKISRGENYRGLPWVTLDYPAVFGKVNVFALRTMFWWGNFISVTILLSGSYKELLQKLTAEHLSRQQAGLFICVNGNAWHHHFEPDNYVSVQDCDVKRLKQIITPNSFIKLAVKIDLKEWNNVSSHLSVAYKRLMLLLKELS